MNQQLSQEELALIAPEAVAEQRREEHAKAVEILKAAGCRPEATSKNEMRKREIIDSLPEGLLQDLRGHILNNYKKEEEIFGKKFKFESDEARTEFEKRHLRGALFEMLIQYDTEITPPLNETAQEILGIMQNPEVFGLENIIGYKRNPDETYVEIDEKGQIFIKVIGEAKLGHVDERFLSQMESFDENLQAMVDAINKMTAQALLEHGLIQLAARRAKIDEEFAGVDQEKRPKTLILGDGTYGHTKVLAIPADRLQDFESMMKYEHQNETNRERFIEIMGDVTVKRSAFKAREVGDMADALYNKMF